MDAARNIYEQQAHNKRLTWVVMAGFVLFLAFIGFGFDYYFLPFYTRETFLPIGTIIAVIVGSTMAMGSLQSGAKSVLQSTGAVPADPANPAHRQFINVVEEMSIASGIPKPQVFVVPDAIRMRSQPEKIRNTATSPSPKVSWILSTAKNFRGSSHMR